MVFYQDLLWSSSTLTTTYCHTVIKSCLKLDVVLSLSHPGNGQEGMLTVLHILLRKMNIQSIVSKVLTSDKHENDSMHIDCNM